MKQGGVAGALASATPPPDLSPGQKRSHGARTALVVGIAVASALAAAVGAWLTVAGVTNASRVHRLPLQLGTELPATAMDATAQPANNSPQLVADPTDDRFVALANRIDAPDYACSVQISGDGGHTWSPANPVPVLPQGAEKCFGPQVAFDRHGRLYVLFVGLVGSGNTPVGAFLTSSGDHGRTFSSPLPILGPGNYGVRMALDQTLGDRGRIHFVWLQPSSDPPTGGYGPPPNPIMSAHSDDGGNTLSAPQRVSDPGRLRVVAPDVVVGGDHGVHVIYYDLGDDSRDYQGLEGPVWDGKWSIVVATSVNGGRTFGTGVVAAGDVAPPARVMAIYIMAPPAIAAASGKLCLAWGDARNGDSDVFAACSTTAGNTWGAARRVNDDPVGTGRWQYLPGLAIAPGGRLDVTFYDRRDDPDNLNNDLYYASSADGGRTFSRNLRLNHEGSSFTQIGQRYAIVSAEGQWDFGNRMAVLSRRNDVLAAWADTHNGHPFSTGQDIFSASIRPPSTSRWRPLSAGIALLLGGCCGLGWCVRKLRLGAA